MFPHPPDFHGPMKARRTPQNLRRFPSRLTLSPGDPIPGLFVDRTFSFPKKRKTTASTVKKKRELFSGLPPASPSSFALPRTESPPRFRDLDLIPFR